LSGNKTLDVAMIGNEGMYGVSHFLSGNTLQINGLVRQSGRFLQMDLNLFQQHLDQNRDLRTAMGSCIKTLLEQVAQTAACVCFHDVRSRLATLLLMVHDRTKRDDLCLTHYCLADIMGVRRSAVSIAASSLQKEKLIQYSRGKIHLLSRKGVKLAACGCYRSTENPLTL